MPSRSRVFSLIEEFYIPASHLFERTKEELAIDGGAAACAQHAPSDHSIRSALILVTAWQVYRYFFFFGGNGSACTIRDPGNQTS